MDSRKAGTSERMRDQIGRLGYLHNSNHATCLYLNDLSKDIPRLIKGHIHSNIIFRMLLLLVMLVMLTADLWSLYSFMILFLVFQISISVYTNKNHYTADLYFFT